MQVVTATLILVVLAGCSFVPSPPEQPRPAPQTVQTAVAAGEPVALCGREEPGERLVFGGRVLDYQGRPLARAAVVAYHADRRGLYNPVNFKTRVPRLRGVAVTDERGCFAFGTVRPGAYPDGSEPAHVHVAVVAPAHHVRHLEYWFEGDPLITQRRRRAAARNPNIVIITLVRGAQGAWSFGHDVRLQGN